MMKISTVQTIFLKNTKTFNTVKTNNNNNSFSKKENHDFLNYKNYTIPFLANNTSDNDVDYRKAKNTLAGLKKDDKQLLDNLEIIHVLKSLDKDSEEYISELQNAQNQGQKRFDDESSAKILRVLTKNNINFLPMLTEEKDKNGNPLNTDTIVYLLETSKNSGANECDFEQMERIIHALDENNAQYLPSLTTRLEEDGEPMRYWDIVKILNTSNEENLQSLPLLLEEKGIGNKPRFHGGAIAAIMSAVNEQNIEYLPILLEQKDENERPRFSAFGIEHMLDALNKDNSQRLAELLNARDENGNYKYNGITISKELKN